MTKWSIDAKQQSGQLVLDGALTIAQAGAIREALLCGFGQTVRVVLDIAAVNEVDIAGLQLLCAAHRFAVAHDKALLLSGSGEVFREQVRAAGFLRGTHCIIGKEASCLWAGMA